MRLGHQWRYTDINFETRHNARQPHIDTVKLIVRKQRGFLANDVAGRALCLAAKKNKASLRAGIERRRVMAVEESVEW